MKQLGPSFKFDVYSLQVESCVGGRQLPVASIVAQQVRHGFRARVALQQLRVWGSR